MYCTYTISRSITVGSGIIHMPPECGHLAWGTRSPTWDLEPDPALSDPVFDL